MILSKGGAEGYRGMAIRPGVLGPGSPGLGVAIKISDGEVGKPTDSPPGQRAGDGPALAVLAQLGALVPDQLDALAEYGTQPVTNFRKLVVGEMRACPDAAPRDLNEHIDGHAQPAGHGGRRGSG